MKLIAILIFTLISTFAWSLQTKEKKDFSFYKMQNSAKEIEVSPADPRLSYLRGKFQGVFEGTTVELTIQDMESALNFYENKKLNADVSFKKSNGELYFNVNENGNVVLILIDERKFFINMKNWPVIVLNEGYSNQVTLKLMP